MKYIPKERQDMAKRDRNKSVKYNKMDVDDVIFYFKELQGNTLVDRSMSLKDEILKVNVDEISFLDDGGRSVRLQYWQYGKLGARRLIKQTCYPCMLSTPTQSWIKIKIIKIRNGLSRNQAIAARS